LGHVVRTGRAIVLDDVPRDHLVYGSALGRGAPARLIAIPTFQNDEVNGVIELGFAGDAPPASETLLERIAGPVGIALRTIQYRTRLAELLEETRKQAEALRSHTEELSVANEELEEQRRSLIDSQK